MNFVDEEQSGSGQKGVNPFNANIMKGGGVNPRSPLYQRSIAGREKLEDMLQRLWDDGTDEADVFMAGVKALTSRNKGYVGAYMDSKNPNRVYQDNEAKAITDEVMSKLGIGEHPGARLTRPKATDEKGKVDKEATRGLREERKTANQLRGAFGPKRPEGQGPKQAKSVRQQRKEGKREGTGEPVKGTEGWRREGLGQQESGPVSEWQKTLEDWKKGEASTQDVLAAFQKQYRSPLSQSPKAQAKKDQDLARRRKQISDDAALDDTASPGEEKGGSLIPIDDTILRDLTRSFQNEYNFLRENMIKAERAKTKGVWDVSREKKIKPDSDKIRQIIDIAIEDAQEKYGNIDSKSAKSKLRKAVIGTYDVDPYEGEPEEPETGAAQPEPQAQAPGKGTSSQTPRGASNPPEPEAPAPEEEEGLYAWGLKPKSPTPSERPEPEPVTEETNNVQGPAEKAARDLVSELIGKADRIVIPEGFSVENDVYGKVDPKFNPSLLKRANEVVNSFPPDISDKDRGEALELINRQILEYMPDNVIEGPDGNYLRESNGILATNIKQDAQRPQPTSAQQPQEPSPWEGEPSRRVDVTRTNQPSGQRTPAALPPGRSEEKATTSQNRAARRAAQRGQGRKRAGSAGRGFGGGSNVAVQKKPEIMKAGKTAPTLEDFKSYLYTDQRDLFGKMGAKTGGSQNPLEDQPADPYAKYRGQAIEPRPGAQEGGRELPTAGKGQAGQGSLLKKGTETTKKPEARGDFKKGRKPPKPPQEPKPEPSAGQYNYQPSLLGQRGFETGSSGNPLEDQPADPNAKYRGQAIEPRLGAQEGGRELPTAGKGQAGQGSLLKKGTETTKKPEARGDFKKGRKPPAPPKGKPASTSTSSNKPPSKGKEAPKPRRTRAESQRIRDEGKKLLENMRTQSAKAKEVQERMANSPAGTGEVPNSARSADITRRGKEALRGEMINNLSGLPGMTNRKLNSTLRRGGYTDPNLADPIARQVLEGMDRHNAAVNNLKNRGRNKSSDNSESNFSDKISYEEFAQSIRSLMR